MPTRADRNATGLRMPAILISECAVLENGDVVVRAGLRDPEGRRATQVFNRDGVEQETWQASAAVGT